MPDNWHGEGFSIVQAIKDVALLFLRGQEITWHHIMKSYTLKAKLEFLGILS
ncbi:hypothetical protein [Clostridium folliculivorans]|uniref:Uncharacterized protein n=1 Tax=Clostridium folliculivorans TaxID=2886038 RepID=A0A9W5Y4Z0_9CLOT|nr:hypothetical protein [Clostridium folliculivorans]GKU26826.1 hypothetical protein CFOLD11_36530 [Clostridium folliculivorans]GKU31420.1 hypothetical protein CFB3_35270 [Clostridium folliculivorans]